MIISMHDSRAALFHGITIVDWNNKPVGYVEEFNTETLLCRLRWGKHVTAAAFVIPCGSAESLYKLLSRVPDSLQQFICYEPDSGKIVQRCKEFTFAQIERTLKLQVIVEDWNEKKQQEDHDPRSDQ